MFCKPSLEFMFQERALMKLALSRSTFVALALCAPVEAFAAPSPQAKSEAKAISSSSEHVFERAKANRAQIELAWKQTPKKQRAAMLFLLANAPDSDLQ